LLGDIRLGKIQSGGSHGWLKRNRWVNGPFSADIPEHPVGCWLQTGLPRAAAQYLAKRRRRGQDPSQSRSRRDPAKVGVGGSSFRRKSALYESDFGLMHYQSAGDGLRRAIMQCGGITTMCRRSTGGASTICNNAPLTLMAELHKVEQARPCDPMARIVY